MSRLVPRSAKEGQTPAKVRVAATVLAVLLTLFGTRLILMQLATAIGIERINRGDYVGAETWFKVNTYANWFVPWKAPFNLGNAQYKQGKYLDAQDSFRESLGDAPSEKVCIVALNLAWSHEAYGDQLFAQGKYNSSYLQDALVQYQQAEQVAKDARCEYDGKAGDGENGDGDNDQDTSDDTTGSTDQQTPKSGKDNQQQGSSDDDSESWMQGSLKEQQQTTQTRNRQKAFRVDTQMQDESENQDMQSTSVDKRQQELEERNQQGQQDHQQANDSSAAGSTSGGGKEKPSW